MSNEFAFQTKHAQEHAQQRKEQIITNEYDVVKFIGTVHSPIKEDDIISSDLKLATFEPREKEYITEQMKDAAVIRQIFSVYGEKQANKIYSFLTTQVQLMAILGVNSKRNFLVKSFLRTTEDDNTIEEVTEDGKVKKVKKVKQPKVEEPDDEEDFT